MMSSLLVRLLGSESNIDREIDDAFATWIQTPWRQHAGRGLTSWPAVDVYDIDDAYLLLADLPGVAPEDVELKVKEREMVFCGVRWSTGFVRQGRRLIAERTCGRFCRCFALDMPVDVNEIEQGHQNGIYWARLPKQHTPPRKE